jgi:hypothetical protein
MSIDKGMFNFQGVMDTFYGYQPDKDDSEGRAIKNSFMSNMIQSGFDQQLAKGMAQQQSQIAQSNMTHAADLEQRNTAANMESEFNYGMQSMGAQYEFQNQFADNQNKRDMAMQGKVGEETRKNIGAQGTQDRLNIGATGTETRKNIGAQGDQDVRKIGASGTETRKNIGAQGSEDRLTIGTQGKEQRQTDTNKLTVGGEQDRLTIGTQGQEQRATDTNKLTVGGDQQRKTDSNVAEEGRKTIQFTDNVEAGKENRQSARSRAMARSF